jgi:hypothetical protein
MLGCVDLVLKLIETLVEPVVEFLLAGIKPGIELFLARVEPLHGNLPPALTESPSFPRKRRPKAEGGEEFKHIKPQSQ